MSSKSKIPAGKVIVFHFFPHLLTCCFHILVECYASLLSCSGDQAQRKCCLLSSGINSGTNFTVKLPGLLAGVCFLASTDLKTRTLLTFILGTYKIFHAFFYQLLQSSRIHHLSLKGHSSRRGSCFQQPLIQPAPSFFLPILLGLDKRPPLIQ